MNAFDEGNDWGMKWHDRPGWRVTGLCLRCWLWPVSPPATTMNY